MIDFQCKILNRTLFLLFSLYPFTPSAAAEVQKKDSSSLFTVQDAEFTEDRTIERQQVTRETLVKVRSRITRLSSNFEKSY